MSPPAPGSLKFLRGPAPDAMFGPASLTWQSSGRWWSMLGGQRALLLQIADPRVAAGVVQHSEWEANPFGRLVRTVQSMFSIAFGSPSVSAAAATALRKRHVEVRGTTLDGSNYSGTDAETGAWVWATLLDTVMETERRFVGRWTVGDRQRFYAESGMLAAQLGVSGVMPRHYEEFLVWWPERVAALAPDDNSRAIAAAVVRPRIGAIPPKWWWPVSSLAIDMLPPIVREGLEVEALMPASVGWVLRTEERVRRVTRVVPGAMQVNPLVVMVPGSVPR